MVKTHRQARSAKQRMFGDHWAHQRYRRGNTQRRLSRFRAEYIKKQLELQSLQLRAPMIASGAGSRENLVGTGKDDISDAFRPSDRVPSSLVLMNPVPGIVRARVRTPRHLSHPQ